MADGQGQDISVAAGYLVVARATRVYSFALPMTVLVVSGTSKAQIKEPCSLRTT